MIDARKAQKASQLFAFGLTLPSRRIRRAEVAILILFNLRAIRTVFMFMLKRVSESI
jgi:hypothetical protein